MALYIDTTTVSMYNNGKGNASIALKCYNNMPQYRDGSASIAPKCYNNMSQ